MVASPLREPRPASPDPYEPNHAHERASRRPATRPRPASARQPKLNLDSLAIGAPLTAALIGVLLTEGDAAFGAASAGSGDGGAGVRHAADEPGRASDRSGEVAGLGTTTDGPAGQAGASTSDEIVDPVAAEEAAVAAPGGTAVAGGTLMPPEAPATGVNGETVLSGDMTVNLGAPEAMDFDLGESADGDGGGTQPGGRIGTVVRGTDGDDEIHGTPHDDRLFGGDGNDKIYGHEGDDLLDGGAGDDQLFGGPGDDELLGGSGDDLLRGGTGDDRLDSGTGNDLLFGDEGRDRLDGGAGDDILDGGADPDRLLGGAGDDTLIVDSIHDVAFGDGVGVAFAGDDTLLVQAAFDAHLLAGLGEDQAAFVLSENFGQTLPSGIARHTQQVAGDVQNVTLEGTGDHDVVGDSGANRLIGNAGDNALHGGAGDDLLLGNGGADRLFGGAGRDRLEGGDGDDWLQGDAGDDHLVGGAGDDVLEGGAGSDLLEGGAGGDRYLIKAEGAAWDIIRDTAGSNLVELQGFAGVRLDGRVIGDDLVVIADNAPLFSFEDFVGNEQAFAGIQVGNEIVTAEDLLA